MIPFSVNGKVIYLNDITKILFMSDDEFNEEYKDLVALDIAEDISDTFSPPDTTEKDDETFIDDFREFEDIIRQKMS